ncbi:carboxypeptidase-like regulatory domain-containing protein [Salinimicrobium xinjiangense]|uniref:carboxypeptidase-like regulatory domain-containing protein n=1 Tax=Salinimicrobium xinjiangense TaxID=438596 RepID=UPI0003FBB9E2|nr:carboxypeptidase-like regulatory domain-containing protein [Salinimicrobium xinjiangense]
MGKREFLFLWLFSFVVFSLRGQSVTISGNISTEVEQEPIAGASVVASDGEKILGYAYSDQDGKYEVIVKTENKRNISIEVNSLGYKRKTIVIPLEDSHSVYKQDFSLEQNIEQLSTVVLEAEEKIEINRDTISFRVSAFQDGSEKTVEDMLKKLPGIEVDQNGNIKAMGKPIQKILIEGDDLADNRYKVISQNLDVSVIDKIEILSNYDENEVLKQFLDSEKVALNLKLKDSKKSILFGRAELGAGIENRFRADINAGLISPKVKFLNLGFGNNTGKNAKGQLSGETINVSEFNDFDRDYHIDISPVVYLEGATVPLEEEFYNLNTSFGNSLLINRKFSNSLMVKNALYFYSDILKKDYSTIHTLFVEPENLTFTEKNSFTINDRNLTNDLEINFTPSHNSKINFEASVAKDRGQNLNRLVYNKLSINQLVESSEKKLEAKIQYSQKIRSGAFLFDIYLGSKNLQEDFHVRPISIPLKTVDVENTEVVTGNNSSLDYQGLNASFVFKKNKTAYSLIGGVEHLAENIQSKGRAVLPEGYDRLDILSGNNMAEYIMSYFQLKFKQELLKNLFFIADVNTKVMKYEQDRFSETFILPNPEASLRWAKTKTGTYRLSYSYATEIPRLIYFNDNYFLKSYRSLNLGAKKVELLRNHQFFLSHTFSNVKKRILFSNRFSYIRFRNEFSFADVVTEDFIFTQRKIVPGRELFLFQTGITTYVDPLKTSFKLGYGLQSTKNPTEINNSDIVTTSTVNTYDATGTTYFNNSFNLNFLAQLSSYRSQIGIEEVRNSRFHFEITTLFNFKKLQASFTQTGDFVDSEFFNTNKIQIEYQPSNKNWMFGGQIQNILNNQNFIFENINNYSSTYSVFTSVPRYLLFYTRLRF